MARQPNWRRVKRNRNYTYEEAARLLEVHPRTVRNWVQRDGLPALAEQRPHLIVGSVLSDFLRDRRQSRKTRLKPYELYCLRCRVGRIPAGRMVDCILSDAPTDNLCCICPDCDGLMHKRVSLGRIDQARRKLEVTIRQA
jgi:hypothetical protein